ncbi:branched-chain amino acid transaminase [Saccharothrix syringae]|uniref:Branched-chain-amino-acid aminotransferase n=1 Tax=Saccharothrix syringae TaxID=103733 RepID=A0A5Q0GZV2_SACSY|nr:branched-chain amino acid transaminase [Saccharothrix syringae]QFZ19114.1 branched-chain amino acid transaminase [Saccharothrix syringae]
MTAGVSSPRRATGRPATAAWAYHLDGFVPVAEATLPVTTQGLHYGTGVFEGIRAHVVPGRAELAVFRLHDHLARFERSCRLLRIDLPHGVDELASIVVELLSRNGSAQDTYIRPLAYKYRLLPGTPPGVSLRGNSDGLSVIAFALGDYSPAGGVRCAFSSWTRPPARSVPVRAKATGAYLNNALAVDEARAAGYDDAILLNERGSVAEASTANVFAVRGDEVLTPPPGADILEGITRDTARELAVDLGLAPVERDLQPADLLLADEVFLTGTGLGITPVVELAGRAIGRGEPGPVTTELRRRYQDLVRGGDERREHWLTRVPVPPNA